MRKFLRYFALTLLVAVISACGSSGTPAGGSHWLSNPVVYGENGVQTTTPKQADLAEKAELVFYRAGSSTDKPINIYVNHAYLASLLPGGYARTVVCPGANLMAASEDDAAKAHVSRTRTGIETRLGAGEIRYFAVVEASPGVQELVASDEAKAREQGGLKRQRHTISRHVATPDCRS
jgi:hypothetical protein